VYLVTTLEDYQERDERPIEGSLRAAVSAIGPRIVIFRVSGTIALKEPLAIRNPYITIAGQTAPGDGICLRDYRLVLRTHDVIIRHMRFRLGDLARQEQITVSVIGASDFILDHCSISWSIDENLTFTGDCRNVTVQWCIVSEGLARSYHPKGGHSNGSLLGGDGGLTFHHNIYAHNEARNPRVDDVLLDFRNNVIYDWLYRCGYTRSGPCFFNFVNNYLKPGPATHVGRRMRVFMPADDMARVFPSGNVLAGHSDETQDNRLLIEAPGGLDGALTRDFLQKVIVDKPFAAPAVRTDTADVALEDVLAGCGATLPKRDSADTRLVEEIRTGKGKVIDSQQDVGGWPELKSAPAPTDNDSDGMPDEWETQHKLNPKNPADANADANADADGDGHTNIEEYLNATDPQVAEVGCRVDAEEFHKLQRQAIALSAQGERELRARGAQVRKQEQARKQEIIQSLKVSIEPAEGPEIKKVTVRLGDKADMDMVLIPAGSFLMGSPESEGGSANEHPQQKVNITQPFYMAATPVTFAQFDAVLGRGGKARNNGDLPISANWYRAREFCEVLSTVTGRKFRLCTEAEWEYACRAGTTTPFNTGEAITTDQANFNGLEASRYNPPGVFRGGKTPVKKFPPNAWGLYDMHGNEAQYCLDSSFRRYSSKEISNPLYLSPGGWKVLRGGRAGSKAYYVRSACRYEYHPDVEFGFRPVMEMK
jgi:formylglycine-generating enzyme required for sulfatase activity